MLIGVRLLPPILAALDAWIESQPEPKPTRPEAIRKFLEDGLNTGPEEPEPQSQPIDHEALSSVVEKAVADWLRDHGHLPGEPARKPSAGKRRKGSSS